MWPDCWQACILFIDCMTQWRSGFSGVTGLDYASALAVMQLRGIDRRQRSSLFDDLRVMEIAVLNHLREKK